MKNNQDKTRQLLAMIITVTTLAVLAGCGGGGGSSVSPGAPAISPGNGRAAVELRFERRSAGRETAATATGTVNISVTVTGDYSEDGSAFPPVTATTEIAASGGHGTVSMLEIPIGVNHLMTAVATWPDGATDTIKYIIPEIKEGEITRGTADYRTTVIADAAIALAARDKIKLSKVSQSQIDTLAAAVDAFLATGYDADDININDVLDYETAGAVVTTIDVTPATASVTIDETAQFTAAPKNEYGIEITATATWSVTGGIGTIDSSGLFTATTAGSGTVVATSGTVSGSAVVTVSSPEPVCGNSVVEAGEDCDDGNTTTEECAYGETSCTVCDSVCAEAAGTTSYCGDSTTDGANGETCDDGANNGQPNYCNATCDGITGSVCGNSVVEAGEDCDDGNTVTEECTYGETSCTVCDSVCAEVAGATSYCGDSTTDGANGETCDDGANNGQEGYCNATCDGTVDTTPPVQSAWNPAKSATITTTSPTITFTTDENADCKWSLTDQAYGDMAGDCTGDGTTSQSCATSGLSEGANIVYTACRDTALNADTIATNEHVDCTVDTTPPVQSAWNPAKSATINTDAPTITFTTDENGDCKWSLADEDYDTMALGGAGRGDCTGDGTTSQSCATSGLSEGAEMVYVACQDTLNNKDTIATNEDIDYTVGSIATNLWKTIPAGDFVMGCADADGSCNADESPKHTVTLSEYKIQKYEVTNAQYAACVTAAVCTAPSSSDSQTRSPYYGNATYDNYPVIYVNWTQAGEYCAWIGGRLPTEAEWEKAARGVYPAEPIYPWGDTAPDCTLANYSGCTGDTDEVGSHPTGASTYGVMDLEGNVFEWVNDWYASDYYTTGGPPWNDPQGPGSGSYRVKRGAPWNYFAGNLRVSMRYNDDSIYSDINLGFRCAQD